MFSSKCLRRVHSLTTCELVASPQTLIQLLIGAGPEVPCLSSRPFLVHWLPLASESRGNWLQILKIWRSNYEIQFKYYQNTKVRNTVKISSLFQSIWWDFALSRRKFKIWCEIFLRFLKFSTDSWRLFISFLINLEKCRTCSFGRENRRPYNQYFAILNLNGSYGVWYFCIFLWDFDTLVLWKFKANVEIFCVICDPKISSQGSIYSSCSNPCCYL